MAPLNITNIRTMNEGQLITYFHNHVAIPELILFFIVIAAIFLIIGILSVKGSKSKFKFFGVWVLSSVISLLVLTGFMFLPSIIMEIINFFLSIFS